MGLDEDKCVAQFTIKARESLALEGGFIVAGIVGGSWGTGALAGAGLLLIDKAEAILYCNQKVCPPK